MKRHIKYGDVTIDLEIIEDDIYPVASGEPVMQCCDINIIRVTYKNKVVNPHETISPTGRSAEEKA